MIVTTGNVKILKCFLVEMVIKNAIESAIKQFYFS